MHCDPCWWPFFEEGGIDQCVCKNTSEIRKYYNWRKDTTPRDSPRVVWTKRERHKYYPTTIETGMAKICPFSIAYIIIM